MQPAVRWGIFLGVLIKSSEFRVKSLDKVERRPQAAAKKGVAGVGTFVGGINPSPTNHGGPAANRKITNLAL